MNFCSSTTDLPGLLSPRLRASMSGEEPCIKRELESPTPKRQRLSSAQDMFELMHQYSPPPSVANPSQGSPPVGQGGIGGREVGGPPPHGGAHSHHHNHHHHHRRRPNGGNYHNRWQNDRNNSGAPRSPASRRSPYPPNHLRRSPHHGGLRRSTRHRDRHWHHHHSDREFDVSLNYNFFSSSLLIVQRYYMSCFSTHNIRKIKSKSSYQCMYKVYKKVVVEGI